MLPRGREEKKPMNIKKIKDRNSEGYELQQKHSSPRPAQCHKNLRRKKDFKVQIRHTWLPACARTAEPTLAARRRTGQAAPQRRRRAGERQRQRTSAPTPAAYPHVSAKGEMLGFGVDFFGGLVFFVCWGFFVCLGFFKATQQ